MLESVSRRVTVKIYVEMTFAISHSTKGKVTETPNRKSEPFENHLFCSLLIAHCRYGTV